MQHANAWPIIKETDRWRVPVFSTDRHASTPLPRGAVFPKDNRVSDAEIERQINQFGSGGSTDSSVLRQAQNKHRLSP